jgi:hypothetical protein
VDGGAEQAVSNLDNQVKPDSLSSEFSSVGGAVPTSPPDVTECCGVPDIGRYCAKCGQECRLEPSGTTGPADAPKEETHMSLGSTVPGNDSRLSPVLVTGETSDGYHTFNELYGYRKAFNALLFNEWASRGLYDVHKSWHHSDGEPCFGGGWFIVVAQMPAGQVSNHYKAEDWPLFQVPERERGAEWDGHTPQIALTRLLLQAQDSQPAQVEQPSNHTAFSAGPADAGSHETLQQRAEDLWEEVGGGLCICTISTVGHWCEKCQQRIALIKDALRAASASAPAAPREVGGAAPTSTPLDALEIEKLLATIGRDYDEPLVNRIRWLVLDYQKQNDVLAMQTQRIRELKSQLLAASPASALVTKSLGAGCSCKSIVDSPASALVAPRKEKET